MCETDPRHPKAASSRARVAHTHWIYRYSPLIRVTHWLNVLCLTILVMSGLQIFNAHPALYRGDASDFSRPLLSIAADWTEEGRPIGTTSIFGRTFETTGLLGRSWFNDRPVERASLPGRRFRAHRIWRPADSR